MGKKITVLSILCGILIVFGYRLWIDTPSTYASNKAVSMNAAYYEPSASKGYINEPTDSLNKMMPFYMNDGGAPVRNCTTYIKVENILDNTQADVVQDNEQQQPPEQQAVHKKIALTFDDGPHKNVTDQILMTLQKYEVKATFFVLGQNVVKYPDVVKKADAFGHEIANHTWSHKNLTKLNAQQMRAEIDRANEAICDATGKTPTMYRPPFGAIDEKVRESIDDIKPVLWNIDTLDWQHKTPKKTLANLKSQAKDNGIILMHDIHQQSADALEEVILYLKEEGYEFVTTSQLL